MSKLSDWLHVHAKLPQVKLSPQAEQVAKVVANEILDKYRATILSSLDAAELGGDTMIDTSDAAIKTLVDSHLTATARINVMTIIILKQKLV